MLRAKARNLAATLYRCAYFFYPERLRSKITLVAVVGLFLAQALTSTMWSQMRQQALVETPARIAAVRFSDWYLHAESQIKLGQPISHEWLNGIYAVQRSQSLPPDYESNIHDDLVSFFGNIIQERTGACDGFRLISANKVQSTKADSNGFFAMFSEGLDLVDVSFVAVFRLSNGQLWQLQVTENQGWSSIGTVELIYDYFLRIYFFRLVLVVLALTLCLNFIFRPLKKLEKSVQEMDVNRHQETIQLGGSKEFKHLGDAFNSMVERLHKHIEERSYFFSAVSHDLRTPITRLGLRVQQVDDVVLRKNLSRDIEQLNELVNSTLELMRFQTSTEDCVAVDVGALVTAVSVNRQDLGESIVLEDVEPATLTVQIQRLRRCVENLISNGLRYGSNVRVRAYKSAEEYIIAVSDEGAGIPLDEQAKVLRPYYRIETSRNRQTGGYGLGLSICDEVMRAHGGSIQFISDRGRFCVCLHLPLP
ncbi:sensor histidine kinase [Paenalcaligenes sp. Me131]|uniref:sensor histidine kinase n=1 Tax=Paenalcaligenes sp. Me131 TaxID=3392636 RepID=UPI003D290F88